MRKRRNGLMPFRRYVFGAFFGRSDPYCPQIPTLSRKTDLCVLPLQVKSPENSNGSIPTNVAILITPDSVGSLRDWLFPFPGSKGGCLPGERQEASRNKGLYASHSPVQECRASPTAGRGAVLSDRGSLSRFAQRCRSRRGPPQGARTKS